MEERDGWQARAACRGVSPKIFFSDDKNVIAKAKAICAGCEVRLDCRRKAMEGAEFGVWGGLEEHERRHSLFNPRRASASIR